MLSRMTKTQIWSPIFCALAVCASVLSARPHLEMGVNDDWSYIWIARTLAVTGHVVYNGWAAPMLGWQLYLGAFFIKLFGFSFWTVRCSMLVLAMALTVLVQRLFVRLGANGWNASIATLTLMLSPLVLPLSFSFMSDLPGLFSIVLCAYLCTRAMQAETDQGAAWWIAAAALLDMVGGTARQIAWLGLLVMVPSVLWELRRKRLVLRVGVAAWALSVVGMITALHWVSAQPYFMVDKLISFSTNHYELKQTAMELVRGSIFLCLLLVPILLGFAAKCRFETHKARMQALVIGIGIAMFAAGLMVFVHLRSARHLPVRAITPFFNNMITARGVVDIPGILGQRPEVVPVGVRIALIVITLVALAGFWLTLKERIVAVPKDAGVERRLEGRAIWALLGPYTAAYLFLLISHGQIYDRYLLPVMVVLLISLVRTYQSRVSEFLPGLSAFAVVAVAVFSTACLHDLFALDRARLAAANELVSKGISRSQLRAGFEYDSWTQLLLTGYVNDSHIQVPRGAYRSLPETESADPCKFWFSEHTPDVKSLYGLSYDKDTCGSQALGEVSYRTWLGRGERSIYLHQFTEGLLQARGRTR